MVDPYEHPEHVRRELVRRRFGEQAAERILPQEQLPQRPDLANAPPEHHAAAQNWLAAERRATEPIDLSQEPFFQDRQLSDALRRQAQQELLQARDLLAAEVPARPSADHAQHRPPEEAHEYTPQQREVLDARDTLHLRSVQSRDGQPPRKNVSQREPAFKQPLKLRQTHEPSQIAAPPRSEQTATKQERGPLERAEALAKSLQEAHRQRLEQERKQAPRNSY